MVQVVGEGNKVLQHGRTGGKEAQIPQHRDGGTSHGYPRRGSVFNCLAFLKTHGPTLLSVIL